MDIPERNQVDCPDAARRATRVELLRTVVNGGSRRLVVADVDTAWALSRGLGAAVAAAADPARIDTQWAARSRAADWIARVMMAQHVRVAGAVLAECKRAGIPVLLLKGLPNALRYYHLPHLRAMGDIDLLVDPGYRVAVERLLSDLGFVRRSDTPGASATTVRHSTPFHDDDCGVWLDLHTSAYPVDHRLAGGRACSFEALTRDAVTLEVGGATALAMNDERQLVYTCTRWAEAFDPERGLFPLLDVACLLRARAAQIDWMAVRAQVDGTWAVDALDLMLTCVHRLGLVTLERSIVDRMTSCDRVRTRISSALIARLMVDGAPRARRLHRLTRLMWGAVTTRGGS